MEWNKELWDKTLQEQVDINRANPTRPFNLHFYEARLRGRLRIFDLFRNPALMGITIGETLVGAMEPLAQAVVMPSALYNHANYGGVNSQSPDGVMESFATFYDLSDVAKFAEIQTLDQMKDVMGQVLSRLHAEYLGGAQ